MRLQKLTAALFAGAVLALSAGVSHADAFSGSSAAATKEILERLGVLETELKRIADEQTSLAAGSPQDTGGQEGQAQGDGSQELRDGLSQALEQPLTAEQQVALQSGLSKRYTDLGVINDMHIVKQGEELLFLSPSQYEQFTALEHELVKRVIVSSAMANPQSALQLPEVQSLLDPAPSAEATVPSTAKPAPTPANASAAAKAEEKEAALKSAREALEERRQKAAKDRERSADRRSDSYRAQTVNSSNDYRAASYGKQDN